MRNRVKAALAADVAAMVKEGRSSAGAKGNGASPHRPAAANQISEDERALLQRLAEARGEQASKGKPLTGLLRRPTRG